MLDLRLVIIAITICEAHKILIVIPKMGYSHMKFLGCVADTLVDAGYDVVSLQPVIFPHVDNGTKKSRLIQIDVDEAMTKELLTSHRKTQQHLWTTSATNPIGIIRPLSFLRRIGAKTVLRLLEDKELLERLRSENFDLGITELFDFAGMAVFEAIGLRNIVGAHSQSSLMEGTAHAIGFPVIPSFMPASQGITDDSPSFFNRILNVLFTYLSWHYQNSLAVAAETAMREKLGHSATSIWDAVSNMSWILSNSEPLLEFAKPTLHKVVEIGGIGVRKPEPLDEKWNKILSLRKHTVLISFGSVVPSTLMPTAMKRALVEVIQSFPEVTFIWKYEEPKEAPFADGITNLFLSGWTPQTDLLADDRLTLFVTHGGAGSLLESATYGKPVVVIPLFADQTRNAQIATKFGFGIYLNKAYLRESSMLRNAIAAILDDVKYTNAARRIRDILKKRSFTPTEKLLRTITLAVEFGPIPELLVSGRNLSFVTYHNIDIFVVILGISSLIIVLLMCVIKKLFANKSRNTKKKTQ